MSDKAPKRDYAVGRGKPPVHSRFQPGLSGNPRGRRRGSKDLRTLIEEEMSKQVTVTESGRQVTVSKRELIAKQAVNKAAAGDPRMLTQLTKMIPGIGPTGSTTADVPQVFDSEDDDLTLLECLKRLKENSDESR